MEKIKEQGNLKFVFKENKEQCFSPILELYRGKIYAFLLKSFMYNCIETLGTKIFSMKKSYPRTITNLLSSWFFTLYSNYNFEGDAFFPNNFYNTESLKETLLDFSKYDPNLTDVENKIDRILKELVEVYKKSLINLEDYKNSSYFKNFQGNYKITIEEIEQKREEDNIIFCKFKITFPFKLKDKRQENIINNILIPKYIYQKLKNRYSGPKDMENDYIWVIVYRYQLLGSNNNQLGVLPNILFKMSIDFGLNFECFASSINSTFENYCSVYYDVEKYFGSKGNFFNLKPIKGTYGFNPPYQKNIMDSGINKLISFLDEATKNKNDLNFIITIPIWDKIGKKIMKFTYPEKKNIPDIDYTEFDSIDEIINSKYFKIKLMIPKDKFTYLDHNFHLYKNVTIQHTYILVISNTNIDFKDKFSRYIFTDNESKNVEI